MSSEPDVSAVTLTAYEHGAEQYARRTATTPRTPVSDWLQGLCQQIPPSAQVLELGSGPGHDADFLETQGLQVLRTDGARAFVGRLRADGHRAEVLNVVTDALGGPYDLVLANAVLLHLTRPQLARFLVRAVQAIRADGLLAFTVKKGNGQEWSTDKLDRPRYFTYWQEPELRTLLNETGWQPLAIDHLPGRGEDWLFVTCKPH